MDKNKNNSHIFLIGAFALVSLILLMGMTEFSNYLFNKVIWIILSSFFIIPIVEILITWKFNKKNTVILVLGIVGTWFYSIATNLTLYDWCVHILQTIVLITIISSVIILIKEELKI